MATLTPFRYPGSKNKLLPILMEHIDKRIKDETAFTDAFVGGGSVVLEVATKYPKVELLINDKDDWIYSFWDIVCGSANSQLSDLLVLIDQPATLEQFYKLREDKDDSKLVQAYKAIFFNRTTFSGILKSGPIGGKDQKSKYPVNCRYNAEKIKKKIVAISKLLFGRTLVSNLDINKYLGANSNQGLIYLDPPYYVKGSALYSEYMKPPEHIHMASILKSTKNWILSYDDCPEVRELYKDCEVIDLAARYCINGKKSAWEKKNELIILS